MKGSIIFFKLEKLEEKLIDAGIPATEVRILEEDQTPAKDWESKLELQNKSPVTVENITQCLREKTSPGYIEDKLFCLIEYQHYIYNLKQLLEQEASQDELSVNFRFCDVETWDPFQGNKDEELVKYYQAKQQNQAIIIRFNTKKHRNLTVIMYSRNGYNSKKMFYATQDIIKNSFNNIEKQNPKPQLIVCNINLTKTEVLAGITEKNNTNLYFYNTYFNLDEYLTFTCASNQDITFWDCYTSNKEKEDKSKAMLIFLKDNHTITTGGNSENIFNIQIQEESKQKSSNTKDPNIENLIIDTLGTQKSNIKIYCDTKENIVLETSGSKNKDITINSKKVLFGNLEKDETSNKLTIMNAAITGITGYFSIPIPTNSELNNCTIENCGDITVPEDGDIKIIHTNIKRAGNIYIPRTYTITNCNIENCKSINLPPIIKLQNTKIIQTPIKYRTEKTDTITIDKLDISGKEAEESNIIQTDTKNVVIENSTIKNYKHLNLPLNTTIKNSTFDSCNILIEGKPKDYKATKPSIILEDVNTEKTRIKIKTIPTEATKKNYDLTELKVYGCTLSHAPIFEKKEIQITEEEKPKTRKVKIETIPDFRSTTMGTNLDISTIKFTQLKEVCIFTKFYNLCAVFRSFTSEYDNIHYSLFWISFIYYYIWFRTDHLNSIKLTIKKLKCMDLFLIDDWLFKVIAALSFIYIAISIISVCYKELYESIANPEEKQPTSKTRDPYKLQKLLKYAEENGQRDIALQLHAADLTAKRYHKKDHQYGYKRTLLDCLMDLFSTYGRSTRKPFFILFFVFAGFAWFYHQDHEEQNVPKTQQLTWTDAAKKSLHNTIIILKIDESKTNSEDKGWIYVASTTQKILSAILLFLIFLGLRNVFKI